MHSLFTIAMSPAVINEDLQGPISCRSRVVNGNRGRRGYHVISRDFALSAAQNLDYGF